MDQKRNSRQLYLTIAASFSLAMTLMLLSVADVIYYFWPDWVLLTLIAWGMREPYRVGPFIGVAVGVLSDVLLTQTFGVLGLSLALIAFLVNQSAAQINAMSIWQQCGVIAVLTLLFKFVSGWLFGLVEGFSFTLSFWYSTRGNVIAGPFLAMALQSVHGRLRRR